MKLVSLILALVLASCGHSLAQDGSLSLGMRHSVASVVSSAQIPGPSSALFAAQTYYTCSTNRYAAPTTASSNPGLSSNNGTQATQGAGANGPWDIATASLQALSPGTCLNFAGGSGNAGDYTADISAVSGISIANGGTSSSKTGYVVWRCSVMSANIVGGTINGEGTGCRLGMSSTTGTSNIILVNSGVNYVMMDGFEFVGTPSLQGNCYDVDFAAQTNLAATAHHIWSLNNDFHGCGLAGIAWSYTDWLFAIHNLFHDNGSTNALCGSGLSFFEQAGVPSYTPTLGDPDYWHSSTTGRQYTSVIAYNVGVRNYNNNSLNCFSTGGPTDGEGIIIDSPDWGANGGCSGGAGHGIGICPYNGNILIMGNLMWGNGGRGIEVFATVGPPAATGHYDVINNTTYSNDWGADIALFSGNLYGDGANNTLWQNNIGYTVTSTRPCDGIGTFACSALDQQSMPANTDTWTHNMTFPSGHLFFDANATYGTPTPNTDGTNPNFTSISPITSSAGTISGNFALQAGSSAINFGLAFDLWQQTGAVDAGACAFSTPGPVTNCP